MPYPGTFISSYRTSRYGAPLNRSGLEESGYFRKLLAPGMAKLAKKGKQTWGEVPRGKLLKKLAERSANSMQRATYEDMVLILAEKDSDESSRNASDATERILINTRLLAMLRGYTT